MSQDNVTDMLNEDSETTQGSLQGATGVPPNNELDIRTFLDKHSSALSIGEGDRSEILRVFDTDKLAARLTTYIQAECNRARIEELERRKRQDILLNEDDAEYVSIDERIAELERGLYADKRRMSNELA